MVEENLREAVAAIIINKEKKVLMCEHIWIDDAWQFLQGGIEEGENPKDAILRELKEELGTSSFLIIDKMDKKLEYILPYYLRRKYNLTGAFLTFFFVLFTGKDCEFCFTNQEKPEFKNFKWVNWSEPPLEVVYFKKITYLNALNFFKESYEKFDVNKFLNKK